MLPSQIRHTPSDYLTIQGDHDASENGDTILVDPGIYFENLFIEKDITLESLYPITGNTWKNQEKE